MTLHDIACRIADPVMRFNRNPLTIILFVPASIAFLVGGWMIGEFESALLVLTTGLSVDASLMSRLVALKQARDAGDVD